MKHTCHTHTYTCKIMTQGTEPYGQVRRSKRTQGHIPKVRRTYTPHSGKSCHPGQGSPMVYIYRGTVDGSR